MYDNSTSGNYPPGAVNDPSAPWNEQEEEQQDCDVKGVFTLTKDFVVPYSSSDAQLTESMTENHMTPLELINELKERLEREVVQHPGDFVAKFLIKECEGWEEEADVQRN